MRKLIALVLIAGCKTTPATGPSPDVVPIQWAPQKPVGSVVVCPKGQRIKVQYVPERDSINDHLIIWCGVVH